MELTKLEKDILNHRLEVPDSIFEALEDYTQEDIDMICELLIKGLYDDAISFNTHATNEILIDCVEGSTYWAAADGGGASYQGLNAIIRAGKSLAKKIQIFTMNETFIEFPTH